MAETNLMRRLQMTASTLKSRLFRQNSGMGWAGKVERGFPGKRVVLGAGDVVVRSARPFHAGHDGISDLGGWTQVVITPAMVGSTVAVYTQVEVKDGAVPTEDQLKWIAAVNRAGGLAGIAHDDDELKSILSRLS